MSIAGSLSESFVILGLVARFLGLCRRGLDYLSLRVLGVAEHNNIYITMLFISFFLL